jgi:Na+/phosphate symporter
MAISVFVAEIGKTEYKSQMSKRKLRKQEKEIAAKMLDSEIPEEVENV